MAEQKLFAGHAVRRIRRANGLTQVAMAEALEISASYLNLMERNQRPLTAATMLRLAQRFDFDARTLGKAMPGGGVYWVAKDGEANVAGIFEFTEAMMPGVAPHWMTYIAVENAEAAAARVRSAGGEILKGPFNVPGTGDVVIAKDSAGAVFGMLAPEDCA